MSPDVLNHLPPGWVTTPCPDCGNRNRLARRRCRKQGGMCKGTGFVAKRMSRPDQPRLLAMEGGLSFVDEVSEAPSVEQIAHWIPVGKEVGE